MPSDQQYHKEYYKRNKAKRIAAVKKWREENPDKYKEYNKEYQKDYQKNIPVEKKRDYRANIALNQLEKSNIPHKTMKVPTKWKRASKRA